MYKHFFLLIFCLTSLPLAAQEAKEAQAVLCARTGNVECLQKELRANRSAIFKKDKHGNTLLAVAAIHGQNRVVNLLADQWAKWTELNKVGHTALHEAILHKKFSTAQLILDLAEDDWELDFDRFINTPTMDRNRATPLHLAAGHCEHELYESLVRMGADETRQDARGKTPKAVLSRCPPKSKQKQVKGGLDKHSRPNTQQHLNTQTTGR